MVIKNGSRDTEKPDEAATTSEPGHREMSTGYASELHMNEELSKRDQAGAALKGSEEDRLERPSERAAEASSSKFEGGKEAADDFVDQAKKQ